MTKSYPLPFNSSDVASLSNITNTDSHALYGLTPYLEVYAGHAGNVYPNFPDGFYEAVLVNFISNQIHVPTAIATARFTKGYPKPFAPTNLSPTVSGATASLNWADAIGADTYEVSISGPGAQTISTGNSQIIFNSLPNGDYTWTVSSISETGKTNTASGPGFTINVAPPASITGSISGPTTLDTGEPRNYTVSNVSGGTGSYSYQWTYRIGFSGSWSPVQSTSPSFNKTMPASIIEVRVKISSGSNHIYRYKKTYWENGGSGA